MTLKNTDKLPAPSPAPPPELTALWDMESADYECDCPGPPPEFRLPPPPRPPFLQEAADCSELPLPDLETCDAVPVIDAEYHSSPVIPSITVIVVCSVLLLAMVLIASVLVWNENHRGVDVEDLSDVDEVDNVFVSKHLAKCDTESCTGYMHSVLCTNPAQHERMTSFFLCNDNCEVYQRRKRKLELRMTAPKVPVPIEELDPERRDVDIVEYPIAERHTQPMEEDAAPLPDITTTPDDKATRMQEWINQTTPDCSPEIHTESCKTVKHKRKMQNFLPCKTSPQNRCDVSNGNGVIYEDLTNIRPRTLPNHCAMPGQTAPSIEMIDVKSASNYNSGYPVLGNPSVFICPAPRPDPYNSQDLYNPVYEELSNGSGDRGESDPESEGIIQAPASEDEFAEDELSLGETQLPPGAGSGGSGGGVSQQLNSGTSSLQGSTGNDLCRDLDSSDADDRSRFLVAGTRNFSLPPGYRSRTSRAPHQHRTAATAEQRRPRSLDRRRGWRSKAGGGPQQQQTSPQPQVSPAHRQQDCGEFHEGLLLDALLQLYPTVMNTAGARTGGSRSHHHPVVPSVAHRLPYLLQQPPPPPAPAPPQTTAPHRGSNHVVNPYESVPVLNHLHQQQQQHHGYTGARELFSTFRRGGGKSQSQDSSFGSDSGYSNNTSSRGRETTHRLSAHSGDLVIS